MHEDVSKDFGVATKEEVQILFECGECGRQADNEQVAYWNTTYQIENWHCPEHPDATIHRIINSDVEGARYEMLKAKEK